MFEKIKKIYLKTFLLINLRALKEDVVVKSFINFLRSLLYDGKIEDCFESYAKFITALNNRDFSLYIKENLPATIKNVNLVNEIEALNEMCKIKFSDIKEYLSHEFSDCDDIIKLLPQYKCSDVEFDIDDIEDIQTIRTYIFEDDELKPVTMDEPLKFKNLVGYEEQKKTIYENTKSLLKGKKVNNILLYGDAGCGKSTTVRALLNEFKDIHIVQVFKKDLINLAKLYQILKSREEKFIIFADDISFDENDGSLSTMKAVLEGSLVTCPKNVCLYATSNRRHLVKESFSAREGDEIHLNDTINEISSLSERFGISLLFAKPNNEEFNEIVLKLAMDEGVFMDKDELISRAQRLSLLKGSRSPRIARQLIDSIKAGLDV